MHKEVWMKALTILAFVLFSFQDDSCAQPTKSNLTSDSLTWTIYIAGKPNTVYLIAQKTVAQRWGINIEAILEGCVVMDGGLTEHQLAENEKLFAHLSDKYGPNWRKKFEMTVKSEFDKINKQFLH